MWVERWTEGRGQGGRPQGCRTRRERQVLSLTGCVRSIEEEQTAAGLELTSEKWTSGRQAIGRLVKSEGISERKPRGSENVPNFIIKQIHCQVKLT